MMQSRGRVCVREEMNLRAEKMFSEIDWRCGTHGRGVLKKTTYEPEAYDRSEIGMPILRLLIGVEKTCCARSVELVFEKV